LINGLFGWIWKSSCEPFRLCSRARVRPDPKTDPVFPWFCFARNTFSLNRDPLKSEPEYFCHAPKCSRGRGWPRASERAWGSHCWGAKDRDMVAKPGKTCWRGCCRWEA
jgi:hypothetical protein